MLLDGLVQALHVYFADTFRASHHVGGIHGLVGTDHHEFLYAVFHRQVGHNLRAFHIVLYALAGIVFHHWHMLVGSGMEHVVGMVFPENGFHVALVADGGHYGFGLDVRILAGHHQAAVVLWGFGLVDEHQLPGVKLGNLPDYFAADTAG